ncbi:MAG: hypothetical protein AAF655_19595 [Bacteroidota bacterium]
MQYRLASWFSVGTVSLFLGLAYFLWHGMYGFSDTDQGFILGLSWRIYNGEIPYLDFIYVRPPLTLYLHTLSHYFPSPILVDRLLFYVMISVSVWVCTRTIQDFFDFQPIGISPAIFAAMAFICSAHNFPPMAWHTVDGIFWSSLGLYAIGRAKQAHWTTSFIGLFFLLLAALSKQAFYPMLPAGMLLSGILHGWRHGLYASLSILIGIGLLFLSLWMFLPDYLSSFLLQTTSSSSLADLWEKGILSYGKALVFIAIPFWIGWRIQNRWIFPKPWNNLPGFLSWGLFFGLIGLNLYRVLSTSTYAEPGFGFSQSFFLIAMWMGIKGSWVNTKANAMLLAQLAVAWCVSISWGYNIPMLYFTPMLFAFLFILYDQFDFRVPRYFFGVVAILLLWAYSFINHYHYRDGVRPALTHYLSTPFPALTGIYTSPANAEKLEELKMHTTGKEDSYTVLPGMPVAHYLTQSRNPLAADWTHDGESLFSIYSDLLLMQLIENTNLVLVEKDQMERIMMEGKFGSSLTRHVIDHAILIEEGKYFDMYTFSEAYIQKNLAQNQ